MNGIEITIMRVMICHMLSLLEYIDHPRFHCNFISAPDLIKFILTFSSVILISIGSMKLLEGLYITFLTIITIGS